MLSLAVWLELAQFDVLRNLEGNRGLQERCLPIADRARLIVVKLRLPTLCTVLTVFGEKDRGNEKFLVRRARMWDDSASAG